LNIDLFVMAYIAFAQLLLGFASARDIVFPPVSGFTDQQFFGQGGIDISTGSAFAGLTTYANLPYVHCLANEDQEVERYDIAILGAPFDTVGFILFNMSCKNILLVVPPGIAVGKPRR
jgi:agmatinase